MNKREFIKAVAGVAVSIVAPRFSLGELETGPKTYVYKTARGCEIKADVYASDGRLKKPVILWIHGGALIAGSREAPPEWLNPDQRCVVVSIDYRLAPETKLSAIIQDVQDAYRWVREEGAGLFGIDPRG